MDLTTMKPAEVDGLLFPILDQLARKDAALADYRWMLGEVGRQPRGASWSRRNVGEDGLEYNDPGVQRASFEEGKAQAEEAIAGLEADAAPYEAEFDRRPWTRYLVVPGGHLHFRGCHTLTPGRTMVGQIAEASGLDQAEVVGKYGVTACTHCFPDAPVEPKKTPAEEGFCAHSGEYLTNDEYGQGRRYCRCPKCGEQVAVTQSGKFRKHKVPA